MEEKEIVWSFGLAFFFYSLGSILNSVGFFGAYRIILDVVILFIGCILIIVGKIKR